MSEGKNMDVLNNNNNAGRNLSAAMGASTPSTGTSTGTSTVGGTGSVPTTTESGKFVKIIKRYQNRKLYDTHQSCYVTLDEIAEMIIRGEEVMVQDNRTKKDITSNTLTQIIFEKQKRSKAVIPVSTLRDIIHVGGGTFSGFLARTVESGSNVLSRAKADLDRAFLGAENLRGAFQITQRAAEDLRKAIDDRAQSASVNSKDALNAAQSQLQNLSSQLNNLEKLIEAVETRSGNA